MVESTLFKRIDYLTSNGLIQKDVLVKNGKIVLIAPSIKEHAELIIKEEGLILMPGVIDPHVHFYPLLVTSYFCFLLFIPLITFCSLLFTLHFLLSHSLLPIIILFVSYFLLSFSYIYNYLLFCRYCSCPTLHYAILF